jgi:O-antigen/teichoic acid export membrane protein
MLRRVRLLGGTSRDAQPSARSAALVYVGLGLSQRAISFVLIPFLTAVLTTSQYGTIAALTSLVALLSMFLGLGLETAVFRGIATATPSAGFADQDAALRQFLMLWVPAFGLAAAGVLWMADISLASASPSAVALATASGALSTSAYSYALPALRAREALARYALVTVVSIAVQVGATITLVIVWDMGVMGWALATSANAAAVYALAWTMLPVKSVRVRAIGHLKVALRFTLPLLPHQLLTWASSFVDRLIMIALVSASVVGIYSLAYQTSIVLALVMLELNRALMPTYARLGRHPIRGDVERLVGIHRSLMVSATGLAILAIPLVAPVLFNGEFDASVQYLAPLFVAQLAYGLYFVPANLITLARGQTQGIWMASATGAALNVGLNFLLLKRFEEWGAVAATLIAYVGMVAVASLLERRASAREEARHAHDWRSRTPILLGLTGVAVGAVGSAMSASGPLLAVTSVICLVLLLCGPVNHLRLVRAS